MLRSYMGPYVLTFFISLFVLLMQFIWKYIDDLAGKGLETSVIAELLIYASTGMVPMALPLAILLSSIMIFGAKAEHYELVASKAAGISLIKMMHPLILFMVVNAVFAFYFSNYVMPVANLKTRALVMDIQRQRPAIDIKPGVFYYGLKGLTIRIDKVAKNKKDLTGILVYDHTTAHTGNSRITLAESGTIEITNDERFLMFRLHKGIMYDEAGFFVNRDASFPHIKNKFKEQIFLVDLSEFKLSRNSEGMFKDHYTMLNVTQLNRAMEDLNRDFEQRVDDYSKSMRQTYFFGRGAQQKNLNPFAAEDSAKKARINLIKGGGLDVPLKMENENLNTIHVNEGNHDLKTVKLSAKDFVSDKPLQFIDKARQEQVIETALNIARGNQSRCNDFVLEMKYRKENVARHDAEWHKKFTLSVACIVLFFIGAPLGAIIKRGGFGLPFVASVLIFIFYYVLSTIGEKAVKQLTLTPFWGMWLSTIVLIPIGIFLTIKANNDSKLFNRDAYYFFFQRLKSVFKKSS